MVWVQIVIREDGKRKDSGGERCVGSHYSGSDGDCCSSGVSRGGSGF